MAEGRGGDDEAGHDLVADAEIDGGVEGLVRQRDGGGERGEGKEDREGFARGVGALVDGTEVSAGDLRRLCCDADLLPVRVSLTQFLSAWLGGPRDWFVARPGACFAIERLVDEVARELGRDVDIMIAANPCFGLDFAAVAQDIFARKLSSPRKFGIYGGLTSTQRREVLRQRAKEAAA